MKKRLVSDCHNAEVAVIKRGMTVLPNEKDYRCVKCDRECSVHEEVVEEYINI